MATDSDNFENAVKNKTEEQVAEFEAHEKGVIGFVHQTGLVSGSAIASIATVLKLRMVVPVRIVDRCIVIVILLNLLSSQPAEG